MLSGISSANLTEDRFRELWKRTSGKEEERLAAVLHALENGIPQGKDALGKKPGIRAAVLAARAPSFDSR